MAAITPWYAGRCVRRNDKVAYIEVLASKTGDEWSPVENPRRLFPKMGEVEMRGLDSLPLRPGEWIAFQVVPGDRKGHWRATRSNRLYTYYDLHDTESMEEIRKKLTLEGLPKHCTQGTWMIRTNGERIIQVELIRSNENTLVISKVGAIPVYDFELDGIVLMPTGVANEVLYELKADSKPSHIYDWTPDKGYIERVARWISGSNSAEMTQITSWLQKHADEKTSNLTINPNDLLAIQHALRSGELAKRLHADQTTLRKLTEALATDSKVAGLVEQEMKFIFEEERNSIRRQLESQLIEETKNEKNIRKAEIESELKNYAELMRAELAQKIEQAKQQGEAALAEYESTQKSEIERTLAEQLKCSEEKKAAHEQILSKLLQHRNSLTIELKELEESAVNIKVFIKDLEEQKAQRITELEELKATTASQRRGITSAGVVPFARPENALVWVCSEAGQIIKDCPLLTGEGKKLMEQFLALTLAGETPLLIGPDVSDFLLIAESLIASGRSARLEADPTVLTFEDLWVRAGTGLPTSLSQGLELASGPSPCSILAVIERVERSGARYWLPALNDRARRGDLPRRFFLCATVEDADCEEAEALRSRQIWLPVKDAIAKDTAAVAPLWLSSRHLRELDPGDYPTENIESGLQVAQQLANRLGLVNTLRTVRAATEVAAFHTGKSATEAMARLVTLFLDTAVRKESTGSTH
ncbi:hypothetical protein [Pseudomonas asiatica]|uniref:hypothetical protein n=1 Tax=Pseudomonas asiatica TaxID=2219225 RepID=UPI0010BFEBDE|nr:hypothetical protein [Pseudomonas asiatica]